MAILQSNSVTSNDGVSLLSVPVATIITYSGGSAPSGYLLCNGAAVSRSTYSNLWNTLGTWYGAGNGSTTFNIPNLLDRFPVGAGNLYALNAKAGSADAVVVSHRHNSGDPDRNFATTQSPGTASVTNFLVGESFTGGSGSARTHTGLPRDTTGNVDVGVSGTNANLPPYIGLYFCIKY